MNKSVVLVILLAVFSFGCSKKITGTLFSEKGKVDVGDIDFEYFTAKSKIKYHEGKNRVSGNAHIRIKKDSIIWLSLSSNVGVEVSKGIITPDTIIVINRFEKVCYLYNFEKLSKYFNFNVDYNILQSLLLGNMPFPQTRKDHVSKQGPYHKITQTVGSLDVENYISMSNGKLESVIMTEKEQQNSMSLKYSEFGAVGDVLFPFVCLVNLTYETERGTPLITSVNIQHTKTEFSDKPIKFPFNIPNRYVFK